MLSTRNLWILLRRSTISTNSSALVPRRTIFELPFPDLIQNSKKQVFTEQRIVKLTKLQLYNVVANVDDYHQFVPNCIESRITERTATGMEAEMIVGLPRLLTEKYTSVVELDKPNRILVRAVDSTVLKHLVSEWRFETLSNNQTLIIFRVEFEFYSKLHSKLMNFFFEDLSKKTMQAFLNRALLLSSNPLSIKDST